MLASAGVGQDRPRPLFDIAGYSRLWQRQAMRAAHAILFQETPEKCEARHRSRAARRAAIV